MGCVCFVKLAETRTQKDHRQFKRPTCYPTCNDIDVKLKTNLLFTSSCNAYITTAIVTNHLAKIAQYL